MPYVKIHLGDKLIVDGNRELDYRVADRVMGWSRLPGLDDIWFDPSGDNRTVPNYSTDRNEAAKVLNEIERRDLVGPFVEILAERSKAKEWLQGIFPSAIELDAHYEESSGHWFIWIILNSLPEAICEAALEVIPRV